MRSLRRKLASGLLICLGSVGVGAAVSSHAGATAAMPYAVTIKDYGFAPETLEIPLGATVTWTNKDDEPHTVTATKKSFASAALDTNDKVTFEFKTAGTFDYYCTLHPRMTGKVIVKEASAPSENAKP